MLDRNFIDRIVELSPNQMIELDGVEYSTKQLYKVAKPMAARLNGNSLKGLVEFVKKSLKQEKITYPLMINVSHNQVDVHSQLSENLERDFLFTASPLTPDLNLGRSQTIESFIVKLQTVFVETENRNNLLKLVSNFVAKDSIEIKDTGFSQSVTVNQGVTLTENVEVQPIVSLQPFRTFTEIEQVETLFLFRLEKSSNATLHEADGGAWKSTVRDRITDYLEEELADLISSELVVVIG